MIKGGAGRVDALDGIRGIAILLVLAVHWLQPYFAHFPGGYVGVDVFFVLSGFLITSTLWRPSARSGLSQWLRFERRRVQRLYPALIAFLIVGVIVVWITNAPTSGSNALKAALFSSVQLSSFVAGSGSEALRPFGHTWSLSVEWIFYLVWPIAIIIVRTRLTATTAAASALVLAIVLYAVALPASADWFYFGPVSRSAQILVGAALALFVAGGHRFRVATAFGVGATGALIAWTFVGSNETETAYRAFGYPLATVAAVCLIGCALRADHRGARALSWAPLSLLGRVSYSLYLWHVLGIEALTPETLPLPRVALGAIAVIGTVVFTAASYLLLERPVLRPSQATRSAVEREAAEA